MFRRFASRLTHTEKGGFNEAFWEWYLESFSRKGDANGSSTVSKEHKKLTHSSSSVQTVQKWFENLGLPVPSSNQVIALMKSPFSQYDLDKTFHLVRYFQLCEEGFFLTNSVQDKSGAVIKFQGADNWENVMCYLDALLFSMFANLESFEPILFISNQHENYLVNQLASMLRVYVSLLRSGNLITTDLTERICEILMKLGFKEAMSHKQQDSAALFEFLTETLSMPLLTFKIDIKHGGKFSKDDDQKFSKERILFVSIPDDEGEEIDKAAEIEHVEESADADGILLEECLEHYFNNSISVKRELERRATLELERAPIGVVTGVSEQPETDLPLPVNEETNTYPPSKVTFTGSPSAEGPPAISKTSTDASIPTAPLDDEAEPFPSAEEAFSSDALDKLVSLTPTRLSHQNSSLTKNNIKVTTRTRSSTLSIWSFNDNPSKKEVSLPAWMFLRLLPFYTDDNNVQDSQSIAKNSKEFVNRRPILPICLKRYSFNTSQSSAKRSTKRIIIPPIINLPKFVADDSDTEMSNNFKLILESAICHRGTSISSGHFVSVIRKDTNNVDNTEDEAYNAPWYLYDDMKKLTKVVEKTFKDIFNTEWPYMLFYRLVSDEETSKSSASSVKVKTPVYPPHGSKNKFWNEDPNTLSPILSANYSSSYKSEEDFSSLKKHESVPSSNLSIPLPEIQPTDAKFIDIREKYFWYVTDKDKNYYKELPTVSTHGTRGPSISITPQFRRNSQWSDKSNISSINNQMNGGSIGHDLNLVNDQLNKLELSKDRLNKKTSKEDFEDNNHHNSKENPIEKHSKPTTADKTNIEAKRSRKKREDYKKDKCTIM
ncbi:cysteine proteinase [Suhomyces tanzawaensis NRRL Y-17324]|uniref:ubiquitinyl hydrolase 1 n=1 Tax=Suhomyces tanzawaensis NRRL Y-17324 TaxID=984487 RepID=A0A1E4SFH7_9ASCO|nr:cysteine proteinase [Suhomyces tanzawaensis NRRL Y-17324]ODV78279.1 cysteine proteinase [Suhomyces tanzawaensis NRRL Y-17324]